MGVIDYLDAEAVLATGHLHPGGAAAASHLLASLHLTADDVALDLGCGTGATASAAAASGATVVAADLRPAMLATARRRRPIVTLILADADTALPFTGASFDAAWAESVVALLEPRRVIRELVRVLRPGGRLALNERIWRPGTTPGEAARINDLSVRCFGIPAAAVDPLDRNGWAELLELEGCRVDDVTAVADLDRPQTSPALRDRLLRQRHLLARPHLAARSLRWRWLSRRHREAWAQLESWIFVAERTP